MFRKIILALGVIATVQPAVAAIDIAQGPLFISDSVPPLNMLVMGRDHKLYYEAYNDASDLNGDGIIDVGYKGYLSKAQGGIDYYGYFNSYACYTYADGKFSQSALTASTTSKTCSSAWSGDFLNYLATSRMDALRKVLYGGYRATDTATTPASGNNAAVVGETVLQGVYIPQDAHSWGKEYESVAKDGYRIDQYTPLAQPKIGFRHLFAVVSLTQDTGVPQIRVLTNNSYRIWNWVSKERPVAGDECLNSTGGTVACTTGGPTTDWSKVPSQVFSNMAITFWKAANNSTATSANLAAMDTLFSAANSPLAPTASTTRCGNGVLTTGIQSPLTTDNNMFVPGANTCTQEHYRTLITGTFTAPETGVYQFSVDGDDAVDFQITNGAGTPVIASRYGNNGASNAGGQGTTISSISLTEGQQYAIRLRHQENTGGDNWYLWWKTPTGGTSTVTDYNSRVVACPSSAAPGSPSTEAAKKWRDDSCVVYANGQFKPTGILHDYGANNKMYFGLLSGSYAKNISGGVIRSNIQSFAREINSSTGQFCSSNSAYCTNSDAVRSGIVDTINKFRIYDFRYGTSFQYGCGWIGDRSMTQSDTCYMWGNPVSEMMYETLRYFAGAASATSAYNYTSGPDDNATGHLNLPKPTWISPYKTAANGGGGYPTCSVPAMTVISDINPSYDVKVPGAKTSWQADNTAFSNSGDPASISSLNVSTETNAIGVAEGMVGRDVFIGESNDVVDNAPTAKRIVDLATVRGMAPEEPSKQGTYYSAGVARFAANNKIGGSKKLITYAVALASPLPKIKFPVNGNTVTVVPFAKSVSGSYNINPTANFQPTDQ
ncbi:MAG: PA14 domain-containing protein, partial [Pseudomonas sp.]